MSATLPFLSRVLPACALSRSSFSRPSNFSEENWERLHSCAALKVGLESQIAELLGGGLHVSGLLYISSQLVHPALRASSIFVHPSLTCMIQSLSPVKLMLTKCRLKFNYCPDFELLGKCSWYCLSQIAFLVYIRVYWLLFRIRSKIYIEKIATSGLTSISLYLNALDPPQRHRQVLQFNLIIYCVKRWFFSYSKSCYMIVSLQPTRFLCCRNERAWKWLYWNRSEAWPNPLCCL